jgi:flagellar biosynthesis GTPase FlhF
MAARGREGATAAAADVWDAVERLRRRLAKLQGANGCADGTRERSDILPPWRQTLAGKAVSTRIDVPTKSAGTMKYASRTTRRGKRAGVKRTAAKRTMKLRRADTEQQQHEEFQQQREELQRQREELQRQRQELQRQRAQAERQHKELQEHRAQAERQQAELMREREELEAQRVSFFEYQNERIAFLESQRKGDLLRRRLCAMAEGVVAQLVGVLSAHEHLEEATKCAVAAFGALTAKSPGHEDEVLRGLAAAGAAVGGEEAPAGRYLASLCAGATDSAAFGAEQMRAEEAPFLDGIRDFLDQGGVRSQEEMFEEHEVMFEEHEEMFEEHEDCAVADSEF